MQAHAAVAVRQGHVAFQPVHVPDPTPEDVVVRVTHSWISPGTEGSFVRGERLAGEVPRRQDDPQPFPHVPGYQKVGVVEWVGSSVPELSVGEVVFATVSRVNGMYFRDGGHVSPAVTHHSQIWRVPGHVEPVALSGLVLVQVGYNCGMRPALEAGDAAVVIGDGLVGQWSAQTLAYRGARVMLVGRHDERLSAFTATSHGRVVHVGREDPLAAAAAWAPEGVQAVVDTVGSVAALESFYPLMRHDGQLVSAGFNGPHGLIDIQRMRMRELTLHTPSGWSRPRMDATLELVAADHLKTQPLVTHRFSVEAAAAAYDLILSRREPSLGIILDWPSV
jgi:2-desacetyl-2-hydroxyethyl bacteriochlorophyllide A dehydrogenase